MGTRSLTKVFDNDGKLLVTIYRQMDGYPSGHGRELTKFLKDMVIVNGIGFKTPKLAANGMDCLAAQIIAHFKEGIGGIYIVRPGDHGQEYVYEVYNNHFVIRAPRRIIFSGTWEEAYVFTKNSK